MRNNILMTSGYNFEGSVTTWEYIQENVPSELDF